MDNKIVINGVIYLVEDAYKIVVENDSVNSNHNITGTIFDENGNYSFGTDLKLETPNNACNTGLLHNNFKNI